MYFQPTKFERYRAPATATSNTTDTRHGDVFSLLPGKLAAEIIALICMELDDARKLRELRLLSTIWNEGASRALFSHLDVSLNLAGLDNLENVARGSLRCFVRSLTLREPAKTLWETSTVLMDNLIVSLLSCVIEN